MRAPERKQNRMDAAVPLDRPAVVPDARVDRDRWPTAVAVIAIACWSIELTGLVVAIVAGHVGGISWPDFAIGVAYPTVALLCAHARDAHTWIALTLMSALFSAVNVASASWEDLLYQPGRPAGAAEAWAAWLEGWTWVVSVVGFIAIAFFPDGRLPSRRWRLAPAALVAAGAIVVLGNALGPVVGNHHVASPLPGPHLGTVPGGDLVAVVLALAGLIGCLACVVVRFRRADGVQRRQIGWYGYGYAITIVVLVVAVTTNLPTEFLAIAPVTVATGAGIAILRYRLYDIDRIVNRTLTWGSLTALVIALYVVSVGFFQRAFAGGGSVGGLLATAVVAVVFQPLRGVVQGVVNQLIYGYRDQPDVVFRALAAELDRDEPLETIAATLAQALRLPAVRIDVDGGPDLHVTYAAGDVGTLIEVADVRHAGTRVRVLVRPRGRAAVPARDRQLLQSLAPSLAAAAEAVRLRRAVEAARVRAVASLAEEQRRMRRDLHDGLGPVLAGLRLSVGTAQRLIDSAPAEAKRILADAHGDAQAAVDDVRRLSHDLRPPSLDELGLAAALRDRLERIVDGACVLTYDARDVPDPLPAAVEVAAYRIGCEAVLNAVRHAQPTSCEVRLAGRDGLLELSVSDDGAGLSGDAPEHVGLRSMRERAEDLGGVLTISVRPGAGTTTTASLPCGTDDGSHA
jgi:signal transduction histidine kinase